MSQKLKLYIVSILAISPTTNDQGEPKSLYVHMPWIVEATNIEAAGDEACNTAGKWFPQGDGYVDCDIVVYPPEVYERLTKSVDDLEHFGEDLDLKEKPISFRCYTGGESEEGEDVMIAYDRPVS